MIDTPVVSTFAVLGSNGVLPDVMILPWKPATPSFQGLKVRERDNVLLGGHVHAGKQGTSKETSSPFFQLSSTVSTWISKATE